LIYFSVVPDIKALVTEALTDFEFSKKAKSITISKATKSSFEALVQLFDLTVGSDEWISDVEIPMSFIPFDWNGRDEDNEEAMLAARLHLEAQLSQFGVLFGRGFYKLLDIHTNHTLLNVQDTRIVIKGGTDFVIVPYRTSPEAANKQICVVFELKTNAENIRKSWHQAATELIAARYNSHQPGVLVILTDLCTTATSLDFSYVGNGGFAILEQKDLNLSQMATKVRLYLQDHNYPNEHFRPTEDEEKATDKDIGVVVFKKRKIQPITNLQLELLHDAMMDPDSWTEKERVQLFANVMATMQPALSDRPDYMMYS
jgi:hypothetical protein